ncbi:MAG: ABC transporter ATP-binding protein [Methanomassiliicoccaceae archaeon]|nr:ABC transporter ATP-binding protein [Methanomassiliicoccaceae archaeon]
MLLNIDDLDFSYDKKLDVLNNISINFDEPQLVSIIGPNGVGKSTLIHCINRILVPTGGVVKVDDLDVQEYNLKKLARSVAYVPYTTGDAFPLTVIDAVLIGRFPINDRRPKDEDFEKVYQSLEALGITDLALRPFNELSAGQKQKVALARGLVREPKILLLDEPTANLDIRYQMEVVRLLHDLAHEWHMLVIMISHDLNIAAKFSDMVILLNNKQIFVVGTPEEVLTEENIYDVYGVSSKVITDEGKPHVMLRAYSEGNKTNMVSTGRV